MPFAASINFRGTAGLITDPAGQTYSLAEAYPTSRGGLTFGWSGGSVGPADRADFAPYVPEFSGVNSAVAAAGAADFRLDLPAAGTYAVRLALGDASYAQPSLYCSLHDGATGALLASVAAGSATEDVSQYLDATGALRTNPADWRASNAAVSVAVTGTVPYLIVRLAEGGTGVTSVAHLEVADAGGGSALAAGTASFVHSGPAGIAVSATDATGGTGPYTYQWQRRNFGSGSYADLTNGGGVSGATTLNLTDGSAVVGTPYDYRLVYTDSAGTPATAPSNAVTAQVYMGGALSSVGVLLIGVG
jgi:hypothetical protein